MTKIHSAHFVSRCGFVGCQAARFGCGSVPNHATPIPADFASLQHTEFIGNRAYWNSPCMTWNTTAQGAQHETRSRNDEADRDPETDGGSDQAGKTALAAAYGAMGETLLALRSTKRNCRLGHQRHDAPGEVGRDDRRYDRRRTRSRRTGTRWAPCRVAARSTAWAARDSAGQMLGTMRAWSRASKRRSKDETIGAGREARPFTDKEHEQTNDTETKKKPKVKLVGETATPSPSGQVKGLDQSGMRGEAERTSGGDGWAITTICSPSPTLLDVD
jgi:hypothetical protein